VDQEPLAHHLLIEEEDTTQISNLNLGFHNPKVQVETMTTRRMKTQIGGIGDHQKRTSKLNNKEMLTGSNNNDNMNNNKRSSEDIDTKSMMNKNVNTKNTEEDSERNIKPVKRHMRKKFIDKE
jgi:hypothetical protein